MNLVTSPEARVRLSADAVLVRNGVGAAGEHLRTALRGSADVRQVALEVLQKLPGAAEALRAELQPLLRSEDTATRAVAAELLIDGPLADEALTTLGELLLQSRPVAHVLGKAGTRVATAVPLLQQAVEGGMESAIEILAAVAPEQSASSLRQALHHSRADVRAVAAATLAKLGKVPDEAVQRLRDLSRDPDRAVRIAARSALARSAFASA
jgi:hypothetical protein